jgi:NADP-dependent aldehyde dehydrogenase
VLPGAMRERGAQIAEGVKNSVTMGAGQFCTKPGLLFALAGDEFARFRETLAGLFKASVPATMLHSGICDAYHEGLGFAARVPNVELVGFTKQPAPEGAQTLGQPALFATNARNFLDNPELAEEVFGPFALLISGKSLEELEEVARSLEGQLTATIQGTPDDLSQAATLVKVLERKAGRLVFNGYPTGVEVCPSMHHGGPYPATTDARFTSVGTAALERFVRPVCYQNFPQDALHAELRDGNPRGIWRLVNGELTKAST